MADKFDPNSWDSSPSYQNGGDVPWSRGIDLTPEQKMIAGKNIGIVTDAQIDNLIDQFHDLDGRVNVALDNVDTALETVSSLSGDVDLALTGAQQALDTVNTITANFDVLSGKVDTNAANISSNSANITTNSSNIGTLSAKEQIDRADINTISGNVGTNAYNITQLSGKVNTISGNVGTLQSDVSGIKIDITGLNSRLNTVSGVADNALASGRDALNKANAISAQWTVVSGEIEDLKDNWSSFSAAEDAVITAATAAIPGQVSAEVSGQLSGKQDKLTPGVNISLTTAGVIDVRNNSCQANGNASIALGFASRANGNYTLSNGYSTSATGMYAHAEGYVTIAAGQNSHAEGYNTKANNNGTHAEGFSTTAAGTYSHSEGAATSAYGQYSHAEGWYGIASGNYSHAEGYATNANGGLSHAEGSNTTAVGQASHAEGNSTYTSGVISHAEGRNTSAINYGSHAEGSYTISDTDYQHVEGQYNAPATGALHVIGNGTSTAQRSNIVETYTSGVNVNGNLIASGVNIINTVNALNDFIFDNLNPSETQAVLLLNTQDWIITNTQYSAYVNKYDKVFVGDIQNSIVGATQLCGLKKSDNTSVAIMDWKGNISRACWYGAVNNRNNVSSWPSTVPTDSPLATRIFSDNPYLTNVSLIPTNFIEAFSGKIKTRCFQGCRWMSGDITPYIAAFSGESSSYTYAMFGGCTAVDNYATLSAQYPNFFDNPS